MAVTSNPSGEDRSSGRVFLSVHDYRGSRVAFALDLPELWPTVSCSILRLARHQGSLQADRHRARPGRSPAAHDHAGLQFIFRQASQDSLARSAYPIFYYSRCFPGRIFRPPCIARRTSWSTTKSHDQDLFSARRPADFRGSLRTAGFCHLLGVFLVMMVSYHMAPTRASSGFRRSCCWRS